MARLFEQGSDPAGLGNFVERGHPERAPKAHIGFCIAYASVREHLFRQITAMVPEEERHSWTVYCTGHSLGAALATLLAVDVRTRLPSVQVGMYSFGAPKVGDEEFVRRYNAAVPKSFRVVNDADVIARLPRNSGFGAIPGSGSYCHVGRTVLTSPEVPVWVEGEAEGSDPLRDRWESPSDLLDAEVRLMSTVVDGKSFRDHVEEGYYSGMLSMLQRSVDPAVADKTQPALPVADTTRAAGLGAAVAVTPPPAGRGDESEATQLDADCDGGDEDGGPGLALRASESKGEGESAPGVSAKRRGSAEDHDGKLQVDSGGCSETGAGPGTGSGGRAAGAAQARLGLRGEKSATEARYKSVQVE